MVTQGHRAGKGKGNVEDMSRRKVMQEGSKTGEELNCRKQQVKTEENGKGNQAEAD